ncbi:reverse transcriptase domain-containing protein [Tanacetum coccineum]
MPVWCRMFQQTLKARRGHGSTSFDNWGSLQEKFLKRDAQSVSHKCPELAKRFSDSIPKTVDDMLKRVDDYLRSEEAFRNIELPRGRSNNKTRRYNGCNEATEANGSPMGATVVGHSTNDCFHLKRQLEIALESGKLNHLINDVRQRGKEGQRNNGPQKAKVINMVQSHSLDRKHKTIMTDEGWMNVPIIFPPVPARDLSEESLVVEAEVEGYLVRRIHIDEGASVKIMFEHCFNMLHPSIRSREGRTRCVLWVEWEMPKSNYEIPVIPAPSPYNIILGRPGLKQLRAIPSTIHGMMKFPTPWGVATIVSQTPVAFECRREGKKQAVEPPKKLETQDNKSQVVTKEVAEWLKAGIVRPVKYPTWISNPVLVKKTDGSWRMCIHFKNINSACPKDYYPLPEIDNKIEAVMGFPLKCFLDAYKGYHQVQMAEEDKEKSAFYTDQGTYCYTKMPFGLKNAGATFQRLVDEAFQSQIGKKLEVYIDDMVVKIKSEREMLADIAETFDNLRRINMKLNPKKCSFGVTEGKFLGSAEKSLPFFETLKDITKENKDDYRWTEKAKNDFQELKKMILDLPALITPLPKETLFVYLAASKEAVSAVLLVVRQGRQHPVHYVSRTLHDAERNYAPLEKMALALRHVSRRLRRYFEAHPITVITDQPMKQILDKADTSGRLAPYSIELAAYNITYEPRSAIKGQILADFINEVPVGSEAMIPWQTQYTVGHDKDRKKEWVLYTDGAASAKGSGQDWFSSALPKWNTRMHYDSTLKAPTTKPMEEEGETWMTPIINCLEKGIWPEEQNEACALRMKISQYAMEEGHASKTKIGGSKSHPVRILLADNAPGRKRRNTQMRLMPDSLLNPQVAQNTNDLNHGSLAILPMGDGCARTIARSSGKNKIRNCGCGLLMCFKSFKFIRRKIPVNYRETHG